MSVSLKNAYISSIFVKLTAFILVVIISAVFSLQMTNSVWAVEEKPPTPFDTVNQAAEYCTNVVKGELVQTGNYQSSPKCKYRDPACAGSDGTCTVYETSLDNWLKSYVDLNTPEGCKRASGAWENGKCVSTPESCKKAGGGIYDPATKKCVAGTSIFGDSKDTFTPLVQQYLNFIFAGIGILAAAGAVVAGLQYMSAREDPQKVVQAKERLLNVVIGIILFAAMFIFLQWLVPGGIFK